MSNLLVSIIIPAYNVQDYIIECIESCYAQTYKNIEVICIDNNSTDDTWSKLKYLKNKYPNLILSKENKPGAPSARNKGLSIAKGEWIQFLDADDLILPNKIKHQISIIEKIKHQISIIEKINCDLIYANYIRRNVKGEEIKSNLNDNDLWLNLFKTSLGITSSNLWKKDILFKIGTWDESLASSQEYNLLFNYVRNTENIFFDDEHLTIIRERESGQISHNNDGKWERYLNLRLKILHYLKENKKDYLNKNKILFDNLLFDLIRTLYPHNSKLAVNTFNNYFTKNFTPQKSNVTTNKYVWLFRVFGFEGTERIKKHLV